MTGRLLATAVALASVIHAAPALAQTPSPKKVEIVSVTGCLREQGADNWMLVSATDPVPSSANAPQKTEIPTTPPEGKQTFKLIGVGEFKLPAHRDHTIVVKALLIQATPVSRLNVTSVVDALQVCTPRAPK